MAAAAATIRRVAALLPSVLVDLCLFDASGRVAARGGGGCLALLWVCALLRCSALGAVTRFTVGRIRPVPLRVIAAHCLLPAVVHTGGARFDADARSWLLCAAAALAAALFWETCVPDGGRGEKRQRARVLFMRVVRMYGPDSPLVFGGFVFLTLAVLCQMSIPFYTGKVIDVLRDRYQPDEFLSALLFMTLYSLGSSIGAGCRGGLFLCAISSFTCRVKVKLFAALTKQEIGFFETTKTGEITARLSRDTKLMGSTVCLNINILLRTLIRTLGMVSLMMNLSWKLTFLVLMETPVTVFIQNIYDTHYQRLSLAVQDSVALASEAVNEAVSGIGVVRSFSAENGEACRYDNRLMDTHTLKTRRDTVRAVYLLARRLTGLAMQVLMLYYGRLFIQSGELTTGNLVSFILYQSDFGDNIRTLTYIFGDMLNSVGAAGKVFEYLDREPQVVSKGKLAPDELSGHVSFCHVSFAYPTCPHKMVLRDFSLEMKPGQMTALVGPSGQGKSTCVSLLKRLYEPQEGEILLDGEPLDSYDHRFLNNKVALVSQEPVLFSGSIRDNIAYGLAGCSLEEIQEAARQANAHDFILRLEKGYDSEVGEGGGQLAKSERQRIAIARALVRRPRVLILDEITSSLDDESENKVQQALAACPNRTLLVIAHRLPTVEKAHQIVVVGDGSVQERGTHRQLMAMKGSYYKLREKLFAEGNQQLS